MAEFSHLPPMLRALAGQLDEDDRGEVEERILRELRLLDALGELVPRAIGASVLDRPDFTDLRAGDVGEFAHQLQQRGGVTVGGGRNVVRCPQNCGHMRLVKR